MRLQPNVKDLNEAELQMVAGGTQPQLHCVVICDDTQACFWECHYD